MKKKQTNPSAPILPLPETLKTISISQLSKFVGCLVQMAPFWLLRDGATRTLSALAMASFKEKFINLKKLRKTYQILEIVRVSQKSWNKNRYLFYNSFSFTLTQFYARNVLLYWYTIHLTCLQKISVFASNFLIFLN